MCKGWIGLAACAGVIGAFAWTSTAPQAAMVIGDGKVNMSVVEQAAKKRKGKKSKAVCTQKLIFTCCTEPGKQEVCEIKM